MKSPEAWIIAAAAIAACALAPAYSQARQNLSIEFPDGASSCADLRVRSSGGVARAAESFTLQRGEVAALEVSGLEHGQIHARGWDRNEYGVEACSIAAAGSQAAADQALRGVAVTRTGARFSAAGPSSDNVEWQVAFIVHAPKDASLDLETRNGPIDASAITGTLKTRATNGPISIRDCSGAIEAHTSNGPISWSGGGGDVRLNAANGPISLKLSSENWSGPRLEARTANGPVSATLPNTFRSGVRVETDRGPVSCRLDACIAMRNSIPGQHRVLELNGSAATIQLSTSNGPVSVSPAREGRHVI